MQPPEPAAAAVAAVSAVAVTAQAAGALLLALTFFPLSRRLARPYLRRWGLAWACLLIALLALRVSIVFAGRAFWVVYLAAEWYFLAYLLIGCNELARGGGPAEGARARLPRLLVPGLPAAAILAGTVAPFFDDFDLLFSLQAAVLAAGFGAAFVSLGQATAARRTVGFHTMRVALGWLIAQSLLYVPLYLVEGLHRLAGERPHLSWLGYSPLADLCGQLLLAVGMVSMSAEDAKDGSGGVLPSRAG
jgi:hypothetical protein